MFRNFPKFSLRRNFLSAAHMISHPLGQILMCRADNWENVEKICVRFRERRKIPLSVFMLFGGRTSAIWLMRVQRFLRWKDVAERSKNIHVECISEFTKFKMYVRVDFWGENEVNGEVRR